MCSKSKSVDLTPRSCGTVQKRAALGKVRKLIFLLSALLWSGLAISGTGTPEERIQVLAKQGDAKAQDVLGSLYLLGGHGFPQDYAQAVEWFSKAAAQGYGTAQYDLGMRYYLGQGVPQDYVQAARWLHKAAEQGVAFAQYHIAELYEEGHGVPQDYEQAHMWFNLAAASGRDWSGQSDRARDRVAAKMTPTQVEEAQRLAREWTDKHSQEKQ